MAWYRVDMIEQDAQVLEPSLSYRTPAHVMHDQLISAWSQIGPKRHIYGDLAVDLETEPGPVSDRIVAGESAEGGTR